MLNAEFTDEAATNCYEAARRILDHFAIPDQSGSRSCTKDDLVIAENNVGDIEVAIGGHVGLRVPLLGSGRKVVWCPGDWIAAVDELDKSIPR